MAPKVEQSRILFIAWFAQESKSSALRLSRKLRRAADGLSHAGVFFVGDQVLTHEDVIMRDGLHVLDVIFEPEELRETEVAKHFDRGFLFADEFRFDAFETGLTRDFDQFVQEGAREAAAAVTRMNMDADAPDVALPA